MPFRWGAHIEPSLLYKRRGFLVFPAVSRLSFSGGSFDVDARRLSGIIMNIRS